MLVLLAGVLIRLVEVLDVEVLEILVFDALEQDVDMLDLEVLEVLVLLETVLNGLVEVFGCTEKTCA